MNTTPVSTPTPTPTHPTTPAPDAPTDDGGSGSEHQTPLPIDGGGGKRRCVADGDAATAKGVGSDAEDEGAGPDPEGDAEPPYFVPWELLTRDVLKAALRFGTPWAPPNKGTCIKIMHSIAALRERIPDYPVAPLGNKLCVKGIWQKTSFGYSPYTSDEGKISNVLRLQFGDYIDQEEGQRHEDWVQMLDDLMVEIYHRKLQDEPAAKWPAMGLKTVSYELVQSKYSTPIMRTPKTDGFPKFMTLHYETPQGHPEQAIVDAWDLVGEPADYTTLQKNQYVCPIYQLEKVFVNSGGFMVSLRVKEFQFTSEDELRASYTRNGKRKRCPFL